MRVHMSCLVLMGISAVGVGVRDAGAQAARPRAEIQLIDKTNPPGDVLPPGPNIFSCQNVIVDTGSPKTIFDQNCAVGFGLMAGAPPAAVPGFLDPANPAKRIGGIGGGGIAINQSRPLSVNAGGLGQNLVRFKDVANIRVQYPSPLGGISILGTDYMTNLAAGQATTMRRDQSVSFYDNENAQVGFHAPFNRRPGFDGGTKLVFPTGTVVALGPLGQVTQEFTISTGSQRSMINSSLAGAVGVEIGLPVALDPETRGMLYADGFVNMSTQLMSGVVPVLIVNTSSGPLSKTNVPVWVNPDSPENVFGFPELFFQNDGAMVRVHGFDDITFAHPPECGSADFDCDGDLGTDADIESFFACLAGSCPPPPCTSNADFDGDGDIGTDADIEAFFRVLAGASC